MTADPLQWILQVRAGKGWAAVRFHQSSRELRYSVSRMAGPIDVAAGAILEALPRLHPCYPPLRPLKW
ncbi:MAG: hypothetical protein AB7P50_03175 [Alphaproteobacteria bacterium]